MKKFRKGVLFLLMLLMNTHAFAVEVRNINVGVAPVANQSQEAFQEVLPREWEQVLVRMSGNTGIMTLPTIQNHLSQLSQYIEKYSYFTKTDDKGNQQLMLKVEFDNRALKNLLQTANQSIWSASRPLTMVWISLPSLTQSPEVIASGSQSPVVQAIKQAAIWRGIPIIFPAMDLEDQTTSQSRTTLLSHQQLMTISQRYAVDCVLTGAVVLGANGEPQGEWQLFLNGNRYEWQTGGGDVTQVVLNGIDRAADMMANQFATMSSKKMENLVTMQINGVQNLDDYVHIVSTLKRLTPVVNVSVSDIINDMLLLNVKISGHLDDFVNSLKSVSYLAVENDSSQTESSSDHLFYRWKTQSTTDHSIMINPTTAKENL